MICHFDTFAVKPSVKISKEEILEEEDYDLRREFTDEKDGINFSLKMTIEYFINQLRMKYLMRVKKSNEKEDDDNYIYFASRCRDVRKEKDSWHIFYERLWMEISCTFVMKWMAQPFPAINKKIKSQKFEKFSKVEKEAYQFI